MSGFGENIQAGKDAILNMRLPGSVDEPFLMIDYTLNALCAVSNDITCEVYAHQNRLGSVAAITDHTGNTLETFTYSPYGVSGKEGNTGFPFRFTGQKLDSETEQVGCIKR